MKRCAVLYSDLKYDTKREYQNIRIGSRAQAIGRFLVIFLEYLTTSHVSYCSPARLGLSWPHFSRFFDSPHMIAMISVWESQNCLNEFWAIIQLTIFSLKKATKI